MGHRAKILAIDDDQVMLDYLQAALKKEGYKVKRSGG